MKEILQLGENILREKSQEVSLSDVSSTKIQKIIHEMEKALTSEKDGVAIAAPQIGYSKRIFLVADRVFEMNLDEDNKNLENLKDRQKVYINPQIKKLSKKKMLMDEGCLSVRYKYGKVERSEKATIEAYNEKGEKFQRGASGLLAQIYQHEIDHLNGVLFVDKAIDLGEYIPEANPPE
jgi:peptide deformylase